MGVSIKNSKAKKPAAKKPVAKKPAAKKIAAKKPAAKKPAAKKVAAKKPKAEIKRVPPRITRRPVVVAKPVAPEVEVIDTAKAVEFALSIAEEMKRSAAKAEQDRTDNGIKLSRRPTTRAQGKATVKFPAADLKDFRKRLIEARAAALSGVDAIKATGFNESDDHESDGGDGTNQTLRLQALGQMGNINRTIQQIEEALHRIDDGTYGVCTVCGQLIRKPRLLNQPFVLTCMECQSEMVFAVVIHLVLADAVTKELASGLLKSSDPFTVIPGFFDLAYVENRGCAWGMFQGQVWPLAAFAAVALAFLVWKRKVVFSGGRAAAVAEVLLYAGIVGNLIDRMFRGFVIDFFDFHWKAAYHFPCFNLADTFITVAAGLLILCSFGKRTS